MEKFTQFIMNHWLWWIALLVVLVLLIYEELKERLHGVPYLTPQQLIQQHNQDEAVIIDVRDRKAFDQGHIVGAINFPPAELDANLTKLEKYKDKNLVIVDETGQSIPVAVKLRNKGFNTAILKGGLNAWLNANLPLTKK